MVLLIQFTGNIKKQTPSDLLNVARRKHTILRPKPPQQNQSKFTSAESKRLFEITRRVSKFMKQEEHAMFETHHVVPTYKQARLVPAGGFRSVFDA